jgi:hypothetical protein
MQWPHLNMQYRYTTELGPVAVRVSADQPSAEFPGFADVVTWYRGDFEAGENE